MRYSQVKRKAVRKQKQRSKKAKRIRTSTSSKEEYSSLATSTSSTNGGGVIHKATLGESWDCPILDLVVNKQINGLVVDQVTTTTDEKEEDRRIMDRDEGIDALAKFILRAIESNENNYQNKCKRRRINRGSNPDVSQGLPTVSLFDTHTSSPMNHKPTITEIVEFIRGIFDRRRLVIETGVVALVLLLRTKIKIRTINWMRLVLVSLLLANKESEDVYAVWNAKFVGIIPNLFVYEINLLEREFLQCIGYRLHVEPVTYQKCYGELLGLVPPRPEEVMLPEDDSDFETLDDEKENEAEQQDTVKEYLECDKSVEQVDILGEEEEEEEEDDTTIDEETEEDLIVDLPGEEEGLEESNTLLKTQILCSIDKVTLPKIPSINTYPYAIHHGYHFPRFVKDSSRSITFTDSLS